MTRSDSDAQMVIQRTVTTLGHRQTVGHSFGHLRAAMEARMADALKGTSYEGRDGGKSADTTSTTERLALQRIADKASDDLAQAYRDIDAWETMERRWYHWSLEYVTYTNGDRSSDQEPGKGTCPGGSCTNCWSHGWKEPAGEKWKGLCDVCGRWKADHGERLIKPLHEIRFRHGKPRITVGDLKKHAPHLLPDESKAS